MICFEHSNSSSVKMQARTFFVDFDANVLHADLTADSTRLLEEARAKNIRVFVVPGSTLADSQGSLNLSLNDETILTTCGVHPYHTEKEILNQESIIVLEEMTTQSHCLAVGECGLDYSDGFPDKSFQIPWLEHQVELAVRLHKPLYFHVRQAHIDFMDIMSKYGFSPEQTPPVDGVVHCFTGSIEELKDYLSLGFYIGLTGYIINNLSSEQLLEILQLITLDRLVTETDAPYMGFKGCRLGDSKTDKKKKNQKYPNVPTALIFVAEHISAVSGWPLEQVRETTTRNALRFFKIEDRTFSFE
jgi:TatD DNase family protein